MKKAIWWVVGIVVVVLILVLAGRTGPNEVKTVKIGIIAPLTGNVAFLGEGMRNAAKMAETELNARDDAKFKYEVILEDDGFDVKRTASAANKLISIDKVSALATIASAAGNVANPVAEQNKVVHFGIASDPNVAKGDFNFIHWTPPYEETKIFVPELIKRGHKRVAILGANIQGVIAVIDSFKKDIQGTDIKIASEQIFDFGTTDFRTILAKAEQSKPDIYMLEAFSPETELVFKQMKDMKIKAPVTSIESFEQSDKPETYEGLWYVNAADPTGDFMRSYEKIYGKSPSLGAANAYDIVKLVAAAVERVDTEAIPTPKQISESLYSVKDFSGALGTLGVDSDGLVVSKAVVKIIKNGKPVTITN